MSQENEGRTEEKGKNKQAVTKETTLKKRDTSFDNEQDNCGINPEQNPCGDANEY